MKIYVWSILLASMLGVLSQQADASIAVTISDDGTDLTMRATGSYDFSQATRDSAPSHLDFNATVTPEYSIYGWQATGNYTTLNTINISVSSPLTGTGSVWPADEVSTSTPFWIDTLGNDLYIAKTTANQGTVDETAVFYGTTLADLGMVAGETMTLSWVGDSMTVTTIPEPATFGFIGIFGIGALAVRRIFRM